MPPSLQQLLKTMVDNGASDLHITRGTPPQIRLDGNLVKLKPEPLTPDDTKSFKKALKSILRQDPDYVLVGELRDMETIEAALTLAETGHLAFGTLHTNGAVQTINRIVDVFPAYQQPQIRAQLSFVLEGVVTQNLIAKSTGPGRVLAIEVMVPNAAIRNLIREDKVHQIYSQMQVGQSKFGMQTFNQSLASLIH